MVPPQGPDSAEFLKEAGLNTESRDRMSPRIPGWNVLRGSPAPGTMLPAGHAGAITVAGR